MSPAAGSTAIFELRGDGRADGADLLGVWRESTVPERAGTESGVAELPLWRADVSPEAPDAWAQLIGSEAKVRASGQGLVEASARLDAALERDAGALAFAPGESPPRRAPEATFDAWLLQAGAGGAGLAFGTTRDPAWEEAASRALARFSGRVARWCTPWSQVETLRRGHPTGRSVIGLGGDVHTVLAREIRTDDAAVHQRVVALAVTSRATLFRVLGIVGRGATSIGSRWALPGGPLLALPAIWRFVNEVIAEAARPAHR